MIYKNKYIFVQRFYVHESFKPVKMVGNNIKIHSTQTIKYNIGT